MGKISTFLFTNTIAPYRIGLFNQLHENLHGSICFYFDSQTEVNRKWKLNEHIQFNYKILKSPRINIRSKVANNTKLFRVVYFPYKVFFEIIKRRPTMVISSELGLRTVFAIIAAKLIRSKVFLLSDVTTHSEALIGNNKERLRKFIIRFLDGAIAHGTLSKEYLIQLGIKEKDIIISPYSIDNKFYIQESEKLIKDELRSQQGFKKDTFILFYSGQFLHLKGIDLLVKLLDDKELNGLATIKLLLAGGTEEELSALIGPYDKERIHALGFLHREKIIKYYKLADCFVLPTRSDTWGLVVNEALACNCPVVISKYAGCGPDLVNDRVSGYIFDPLNYAEAKNTFIELIQNRNKLTMMANLAHLKLEFHNHNYSAKQITDFLQKQ